MATEKVEMMLRHAEDAFLDRLQVLLSGVGVDDRTLDELVAQSRLVRRLYIFDRRGRLLHPTAWRDDDAAVFRPPLPQITPGFWGRGGKRGRSEEHTPETQSQSKLACRLLLVKNKN